MLVKKNIISLNVVSLFTNVLQLIEKIEFICKQISERQNSGSPEDGLKELFLICLMNGHFVGNNIYNGKNRWDSYEFTTGPDFSLSLVNKLRKQTPQ